MAVIKCKMCGGDLDISEGLSVCECEYCGTKQTVPAADSEKKLTLFSRANRLRLANEFDKAAGVYESVVADFPEEAEAYWGLVLCRYGIEYVDDPATGKKVPTCHRVSFDSVLEDTDFEQACENADAIARRQYREEAKQIEDIRRGIIEVSGKEAPYDIFICYKETDENGDRTVDSVIAQDVYDALTEKGYRVFFSRISLEDKLGTEYEPYIFAALNSAKVMLAFGTDYEHYNAVWVKNEWSRFLKLMEKDKSKHLIPCYKGIDAYDMPKEFHRLQGQDMGKVGAVQDLLRGIEKILPRKEAAPQPIVQQVVQTGGPNTAALLQRGNMALEDGEWDKAKDYFDQVLNMDAQSAEAYLGLAMAEGKVENRSRLETEYTKATSRLYLSKNFARSRQFGDKTMTTWLDGLEAKRTAQKAEADRQAIERISACRARIAPAQLRIAAFFHSVGLRADGTVLVTGYNKEGECDVAGWTDVIAITAGVDHIIGLRTDGTVLAAGGNELGQCNATKWTDVVTVAAGFFHTVGIRADGTVFASGGNEDGRCNVASWTDVVAVAASEEHTVGLRTDGTVLAAGKNTDGRCDVASWTDVIAVAAGHSHTVGLRADGTVLAVGENSDGRCDVASWTDVIAIAADYNHTVGLRADGSVLAAGDNKDGACDVTGWTDVVAVATNNGYTAGLRSDGTVLAVGYIDCDVTGWTNVIAIAAGVFHIVGLRSDGTVLASGCDEHDECYVSDWKLFNSMDTLEQECREAAERAAQERREAAERAERERKEAAERAQRERREAAAKAEAERQACTASLNEEKTRLTSELANLRGLFSGKRRKEIEARLGEIEAELKKLQ